MWLLILYDSSTRLGNLRCDHQLNNYGAGYPKISEHITESVFIRMCRIVLYRNCLNVRTRVSSVGCVAFAMFYS